MVNQQKVHFRVIVAVRDRIRDRIYHRSVDYYRSGILSLY